MESYDRLEAMHEQMKARQKARENAVPIRVLTQIRTLALSREGHVWDLLTALADEGLSALAAGSGTAETSETSAQCEASQSGLAERGNAQ